MEQKLVMEDASRRFKQIMEYTMFNKGVLEAGGPDDQPQDGGGQMPPQGGGADMGGGMPPMDGGAGAPPAGPDAGGMDGGMPPMDGGAGAPQAGPDAGDAPQGPEGFDPQMPPQGGDISVADFGGGEQPGPDDDVIDVSDITDAQEETQSDIEKLDNKFSQVLKSLGAFEELIRHNDEKIEDLKAEFEKRNPTQIEKLSMQTAKSYPFDQTPADFWKEKEATSNYSTEDDNNGVGQGQYVITANDVNGDTNWKAIADSLNDDDFLYNQTLNGVLKF